MKKFLALTTLLTALVFAAPSALAGHERAYRDHVKRHVGTCGHCHHPVFAYRQCAGYDRYDRPIYRWVTARHHDCTRKHARHRRYHDRHHDYARHRQPRYYHSRPGFHLGFRFGR